MSLLQQLGQLSSHIAAGVSSPGDADASARILTGESVAGDQLAHAIQALNRIALAVNHLTSLVDLDARNGAEGTQNGLLDVIRSNGNLMSGAGIERILGSRDSLALVSGGIVSLNGLDQVGGVDAVVLASSSSVSYFFTKPCSIFLAMVSMSA